MNAKSVVINQLFQIIVIKVFAIGVADTYLEMIKMNLCSDLILQRKEGKMIRMGVGEFLIKLCWCFIFFYIFKNTFKLIDFCVKRYKFKETIENGISTDEFDASDFGNIK